MPDVDYQSGEMPVADLVSVEILDDGLCPRYCASVVKGVQVGPSPLWMQRWLQSCGMRPINNIVDVTNYVMLEYGQPLHAFDYECIQNRRVVVRRASEGEVLISLDGVERKLNREMLVISDEERAVAIAGVMGGLNSEVSEATRTVLLESASFNQASVRSTSIALGLRSEASLRFEKGLSRELPLPALRRAVQLMLETAGGEAAAGIVDVYPGREERTALLFPVGEIKRLLGIDVPMEETRQVLESLGFDCERLGPDELRVVVPYWRTDVDHSADLVEEVVRIVGYDTIPTTVMAAPIPSYEPSPLLMLKERVRDLLVACGMQEVITYSLTSLDNLRKTMPDMTLPGPEPLRIANPMSREQEYLRTSLRPRLLLTVAQNQRFEDSIKLFEIGKVYLPRRAELPREVETVCGALVGLRESISWRTREAPIDFFDVKGVLEEVFRHLRADVRFVPGEDRGLRPGRCADMVVGDERIGVIGELHPRVAERFGASGMVYIFEVDLESLLPFVSSAVNYRPLPRFPETIRDMALVVDADVGYQRVLDVAREFPLIKEISLFDVYTGDRVPRSKKSLAFRIKYQSPSHTLTDAEVNRVHRDIVAAMHDRLGATLRA
jgi:phenylalanyl-tRNA synthetase beta chain